MTQEAKDQLKPLAEAIRKNFSPKDIVLFGSYAYGIPSKFSDVDLLVVMDTALKPYRQAALIRLKLDEAISPDFPIDIIVRTPEELQRRVGKGDNFLRTVMDKGVHI